MHDPNVTSQGTWQKTMATLVTVDKVEPSNLGSAKAARFEFSMTRKQDDVKLRGIGWVAEHDKQLYAAVFTAPRLYFFEQLRPTVEAMVRTVRFVP